MIFNNTKNIDAMLKIDIVYNQLWEHEPDRLLTPSYILTYRTFESNGPGTIIYKWSLYDLVLGLERQFNALAADYRGRANSKGWGHNISGRQLFHKWIEQRGKCIKTQRLMEFTPGTLQNKNPHRISLDRIDNDIGYYIDNVRFLTHFYNNAKSTWGDVLVDNYMADAHNVVLQETVFNVPV